MLQIRHVERTTTASRADEESGHEFLDVVILEGKPFDFDLESWSSPCPASVALHKPAKVQCLPGSAILWRKSDPLILMEFS